MKARRVAGFRSARAAAAALGAKPATYAAHENGSRTFSVADAKRYAEFYNVSPGWILTGEHFQGDQSPKVSDQTPYELVNSNRSPVADASVDVGEPISHSAIYNFGKQALELLGRIEPTAEPEPSDETAIVGEVIIHRLLDRSFDHDAEQWEIVAQWKFPSTFVSDVLGVDPLDVAILAMPHDNMSPTYRVGDRLIIDFKQKNITVDGVYIYMDEGKKMHVQRIQRDGKRALISNDNSGENTKHPAITVDASDIEIVGRICGVIAAQ